ncbi:NlpC/P60 family protein [Streptomonospora salina]|uniref:Cell wall-associated NlpC family hydrolase n=1 Tax=Streptomonospora salina TaxID=104205 RepID=A0A841E7D6_9ACTN|nr:NlpC/P60 family protein [Streptomonospora salina]MBB5998772.1 cell wall-associated NlpC family hydrolase [Streptomonospora salina]
MGKWWIAALICLLVPVSCGAPALILIAQTTGADVASGEDAPARVDGIPERVLDAYRNAAQQAPEAYPRCTGVTWAVLAGIGRVESDHLASEDYGIDANGDVRPSFLGPRLDGSGVGGNTDPVYDTDGGRLDGDEKYDRAVGLMQFIPSSWEAYKADGNGDGRTDPDNVDDAALAAAGHLCGQGERDLSDPDQLRDALWSYNHSADYGRKVADHIETYSGMGDPSVDRANTGSDAIVRAGEKWLGTPYLYGGQCNTLGEDRCDCSSLARYAYRHGAGVELPRTTYDQVMLPDTDERFVRVPPDRIDDLRPGDMLFFGTHAPGGIGHVGIYIDDQTMLEAPRTGLDVRLYDGWQRRPHYYGAVGIR